MPISDYGLVFNEADVTAIILPHTLPAPELQTWRTQFAATAGISEIVGGPGGRELQFPAVLRDAKFSSRDKIEQFINGLNALIGRNDAVKLYLHDGTVLTYLGCTFHGFAKTSDPKPDAAGTMGAGTNRWFCEGVFRFYQLGGA